MHVLRLTSGILLGLAGIALLYFCNRVSFYCYRIGDPNAGGSYRNPAMFAIIGVACIAAAIVLVVRGSR